MSTRLIREHAAERRRETALGAWGKRLLLLVGVFAVLLFMSLVVFSHAFGPTQRNAEGEFIIHPEDTLLSVSEELEREGYVRHASAFRFMYAITRGERTVRPGGYLISGAMDTLSVVKRLGETPYLSWITLPQGLRKEEVGEMLAEVLSWTVQEREEWEASINTPDALSGIYFPGTYLIPSDQRPLDVALRLSERFKEEMAPYMGEAAEKDLVWEEVIILASIVERESAKHDKPLVAGILNNRLERGMLLQADATLQYLSGTETNWWPSANPDQKSIDSPFNTYKYRGLPPEPIATPSPESIHAVLNPQHTNCLYYLHDTRGRIHCSTNYEAHKANVNTYLR